LLKDILYVSVSYMLLCPNPWRIFPVCLMTRVDTYKYDTPYKKFTSSSSTYKNKRHITAL